MPRGLVRQQLIELIPAEVLAPALAGGRARRLPLADGLKEYSDRELVSHTFAARDDETAVLAVISSGTRLLQSKSTIGDERQTWSKQEANH
jgi:hypothetical protein